MIYKTSHAELPVHFSRLLSSKKKLLKSRYLVRQI